MPITKLSKELLLLLATASYEKSKKRKTKMSRSEPTYDTHSWDLAEFFLEDEPALVLANGKIRRQFTHELAIEIQRTIEGWIEAKRQQGWKVEESDIARTSRR